MLNRKYARYSRSEQRLINKLDFMMGWIIARNLPDTARAELLNRWRAQYGTMIFDAAGQQRYTNGKLNN